jgi:hypothetical protein
VKEMASEFESDDEKASFLKGIAESNELITLFVNTFKEKWAKVCHSERYI